MKPHNHSATSPFCGPVKDMKRGRLDSNQHEYNSVCYHYTKTTLVKVGKYYIRLGIMFTIEKVESATRLGTTFRLKNTLHPKRLQKVQEASLADDLDGRDGLGNPAYQHL